MRSADFLNEIKRALSIPTYQPRFSEEDILGMASLFQRTEVMPKLRALRQDFFVTYLDITLQAGDFQFPIPERAVGRALRDLWITTDANLAYNNYRKLRQFNISELTQARNTTGETYGYYFTHDTVNLWPPVPAASYIKAWYAYRPNDLVLESRTATITNVGTTTLTVSANPSNLSVGSLIDVVRVTPGYETLLENLTVASRTASTIVVTGYDFSATAVAVGDIVSTARETSVLQLPEDCLDYLLWGTAKKIAVSLGIEDMIKNCADEMSKSLDTMQNVLAPRSDEGVKIIDPNSIFRTSGRNRMWAALSR